MIGSYLTFLAIDDGDADDSWPRDGRLDSVVGSVVDGGDDYADGDDAVGCSN